MRHAIKILLLIVTCLFNLQAGAQHNSRVIVFASDTQEPLLIEKLYHKQNHNLLATKMLFEKMDAAKPASVFLLGDVVSSGKSVKAWANIDQYIAQLRKDAIPVYATLGNHDLMFNAAKGTRNFVKRFPAYQPFGQVQIVDSVAVILLNSNFSAMNTTEISVQNSWYNKQLQACDQNPAVQFVVVGCHHSPYTNSGVVSPSKLVQQYFVAPFIKSRKAVLFLSGHSHNFEHFKVEGKYFAVIGGGGGLHQSLKSKKNGITDLSANYKPMFHYLEVHRDHNRLAILSRYLKPDFSGFQDGFNFNVSKNLP